MRKTPLIDIYFADITELASNYDVLACRYQNIHNTEMAYQTKRQVSYETCLFVCVIISSGTFRTPYLLRYYI